MWREQAIIEWSRWSDLGEWPPTMLVNLLNSWLCLRTVTTRVISSGDLYCCLLPRWEALRTCRSGFPIATKWCCDQDVKVVRSTAFTQRTCDRCGSLWKGGDVVATSPVVLRWLCDSPRMGCAWRITTLCMWREQTIIEWSRWGDLGEWPLRMLVNLVNSWLCLRKVMTRVISSGDLYCCLLPRCEALRTCRSGFPLAKIFLYLCWITTIFQANILCQTNKCHHGGPHGAEGPEQLPLLPPHLIRPWCQCVLASYFVSELYLCVFPIVV